MTTTLTHIALHVRDMDAMVAFYGDFCGLEMVHQRAHEETSVIWLAEPGRGEEFVYVLIGGGSGHEYREKDFSHFGFALESREAVDSIAAKAEAEGCLVWPARQEPAPIGYYCGVVDPDGNVAEFSYGQPLGPALTTGNQ